MLSAHDGADLYGDPLRGLPVVPVDAAHARLVADAHERVLGGRAGVVVGRAIELAGPGPRAHVVVRGQAELGSVADTLGRGRALRIEVDADLQQPTDPPDLGPPDGGTVDLDPVVDALAAARSPLVLAGPGILDALPGLHAAATAGSLGVVNTWSAKGAFDWRSPHHLATIGLQADDFALAGVHDTDLVLMTGVDEREAPPARRGRAPSVEIPPPSLSTLAERWWRPHEEIPMPPLRERLAAVTRDGWDRAGAPLWPSAVTLDYGRVLGSAGLVAADPGTAGFWVARTYATLRPRSAIVPPDADRHGFSVACATVARLRRPSRPVLAVVDGPRHPDVDALLDVAGSLGVPVGVEVWDDDGDRLDQAAHLPRAAKLANASTTTIASLAPSADQWGPIIDAAGPVIAWVG